MREINFLYYSKQMCKFGTITDKKMNWRKNKEKKVVNLQSRGFVQVDFLVDFFGLGFYCHPSVLRVLVFLFEKCSRKNNFVCAGDRNENGY